MDETRARGGTAEFLESRLQAAAAMARGAGEILMARYGRVHQVTFKGEIDLVTEADRAAEEFLLAEVGQRFPADAVLAEEGAAREGTSGDTWVMDPLDGTTNYAHGFPFFAVSVSLVRDGLPLVGVVWDPVRRELFSARRGGSARLNDRPLAVSAEDALTRSLLATGFPYDIRRSAETNLDYFAAFALRGQAIRRAGSAALDLCYVAAGRFDGYWEMKLKPWDIAAGALILQEAGGMITSLYGEPWRLGVADILATNGRIHREMGAVVAEVRAARGAG
jgi:myo-inositol-1(or 4)-monophosphatase